MHTKQIYITGASGFIGSHLINKMKKKDLLLFPISRKKNNEANILTIKDYNDLNPVNKSTLVHLAENNNVNEAENIGDAFISENIENVNKLVRKKWENIIYISTVLLYDFDKKDKTSTTNSYKVKANSIYKKSKLECEKIILNNGGTVLRMTNLYGPGMSCDNVMSDIIKQLSSEKIVLKNLNAMSDFLWIEDATDAVILANNKKFNDVFNIASSKVVSIYELTKTFLELAGYNRKKIIGLKNSSKTFAPIININKAHKILNWKPTTKLETGIKHLLRNLNKL